MTKSNLQRREEDNKTSLDMQLSNNQYILLSYALDYMSGDFSGFLFWIKDSVEGEIREEELEKEMDDLVKLFADEAEGLRLQYD